MEIKYYILTARCYLIYYIVGYRKKIVRKNLVNSFPEKSLGTSIPQLTVPMVSEYEIPVPSLDEQKRIVGILDKFDRLVNDITVGLPAEIELRRKQYEYYRNKLLSFEESSVSE